MHSSVWRELLECVLLYTTQHSAEQKTIRTDLCTVITGAFYISVCLIHRKIRYVERPGIGSKSLKQWVWKLSWWYWMSTEHTKVRNTNRHTTISTFGTHKGRYFVLSAALPMFQTLRKGSSGKTMDHLLVSRITTSTLRGEDAPPLWDN